MLTHWQAADKLCEPANSGYDVMRAEMHTHTERHTLPLGPT